MWTSSAPSGYSHPQRRCDLHRAGTEFHAGAISEIRSITFRLESPIQLQTRQIPVCRILMLPNRQKTSALPPTDARAPGWNSLSCCRRVWVYGGWGSLGRLVASVA
jgi:hypothetical protein